MLLRTTFTAAPYPGLRAFESEECDIFFGRERQTDELLEKLQRNRFLAVIGPSGCGKSSLVRAGLIAALETGFMVDAGTRWRVARTRPGGRPIHRLASSLLAPALLGAERAGQANADLYLEAALRRGPLGLIEVASESGLCRDGNLLVLVDQFEEIFRFRSQGDPEEADAFVALLLASATHRGLPIYIIITMRSDFLGDCSLFRDLPEAINRSAYLIPRLTREECAAAIAGPARVFGGEVEAALVNRLLNDFGPDPDQLPLLQHALMRMWFMRTNVEPAATSSATLLTVGDYEALGGLSRALSDHADEVVNELTLEQQRLAKIMLQRLTERASGKRDTRAPARLADIAGVAGVEVPDICAIVEAFRQPGRCFLTPLEGPLERDSLIDIGHESLIRQWKQLTTWVEEEAQSARIYGRLRETARLWESGQAGLWRNPDLGRAVEWKERVQPNEAWALRYGQPDDFVRAMQFLRESELEHERREAEAERNRERALRHARRLAWAFGLAVLVLLLGLAVGWYGWVGDYEEHHAQVVKAHGVPKGIAPLTARQAEHRLWSLRIVKAGRFGRVKRIEAVDSRGRPSPRHNIGTHLSESPGVLQRREVRWEYLYDADGQVTHEVAYDRNGNRVWALLYSPSAETPTEPGAGPNRVAHYVGPSGYPIYGTAYFKIEYSAEGFETLVTSRNALGEPRAGLDAAFGRRRTFDAEGRLVEMVSVGPDGEPMIDEAGNAGLRITTDAFGNEVEYVATDAVGARTSVKDGFSVARAKYDSYGNQIEIAYFDESDQPIHSKDGNHRVSRTMDEHGNVSEERYWDVQGKPTLVAGCHALQLAHDDRGNVTQATCLGIEGAAVPNDRGVTTTKLAYDAQDNVLEVAHFDASGESIFSAEGFSRASYRYDDRGNLTESAFFGINGQPVAAREGYSRIANEYDERNNEISRSYFATDGRPMVIADSSSANRQDVTSSGAPLSYARLELDYDESGHIVAERYLDEHGEPMLGPDRYASNRATFDSSGNLIEVLYFGMRGERLKSQGGYAGWRGTYDAFGRRTKLEYLGLQGEPVLSSEKVAGWRSSYDAQGNERERVFIGLDGKSALHADGNAGVRISYDRRGIPVEYEYLGPDGRPAAMPWNPSDPKAGGYVSRKLKYDARNRLLEHAFFGLDDALVNGPQGWARVVNVYDLRGTEAIETAYFDTMNRPTTLRDRRFHATRQRLDAYGRVVEVTFHGEDMSPVQTVEGYSKLTFGYDAHGRRIEEALFGADGSAVSPDGIHRSTFLYDERGRQIESRHFGRRNEPVRVEGSFQHLTRYSYDDRGHLVEIAHFDENGRPTRGWSQNQLCARWTATFDAEGKLQSSGCAAGTGSPRDALPTRTQPTQ